MPKPTPTRRTIMLTGAAASLAAGALAGEVEPALTSSDNPTALLAEHRRRAARFFATEARNQAADDAACAALDAVFPADYDATADALETALVRYDGTRDLREKQILAGQSHVGDIDRRIWAMPATTYDDIVARAELAEFWNRGWGFTEHHGYDDPYADRRLADAILVDQPARPSSLAFEPPALLLEYRRIEEAWKLDYHARLRSRITRHNELMAHIKATVAIEQALLQAVTPARSWSDIVVRAELTQYHRHNMLFTWAHFDNDNARRRRDCRLLNHRSYAELLTAVLALGGVPRPPRHPMDDYVPEPDIEEDDEIES